MTLNKTKLPVEIQKMIRKVIRRTRLRRGERLDVANELIVHFEDALEEGVGPEQAITDYGDIKIAAKLLRASKKRQRWWVELALVRTCKWASLSFVCLFLVYGVLVGAAMLRKPSIKVDYIAQLNETTVVPEEDRAWPYYREAEFELRKQPWIGDVLSGLGDWPMWPSHKNWSYVDEWLVKQRNTIAFIHKGAAMEKLGLIASVTLADEDRDLWPVDYDRLQSEQPKESLLNLFQPQLGSISMLAWVLHYDTKSQAFVGNDVQCLLNIQETLHMATQLKKQNSLRAETGSLSMYRHIFRTIADVLSYTPELFSDYQLATLKAMLLNLDEELIVQLEGEQMFMLDLIQRTYTDDGSGDGVIIPSTLQQLLAKLNHGQGAFLNKNQVNDSIVKELTYVAPLGVLELPSRKELVEEFDSQLSRAKLMQYKFLCDWSDRLWMLRNGAYSGRLVISLFPQDDALIQDGKHLLIDLIMPQIRRLVLKSVVTKSERDGVLAAIYAIEYHRETGQWPKDLEATGLIDTWSRKPLKIINIDGVPSIYSVGNDLDDDRGKPGYSGYEWSNSRKDSPGDWVFWTLNGRGPSPLY